MRRVLGWVLVGGVLQALLVGIYWMVEHERPSNSPSELGTDAPLSVDLALPTLDVTHPDGTRNQLTPPRDRPALVHVWATWCPPCRAELPSLLELPTKYPVHVVAVALDDNWADVEHFVGPTLASRVVLGDPSQVARLMDVRQLPVTWLLSHDGRLSLRFDGARDWADDSFVERYVGVAR